MIIPDLAEEIRDGTPNADSTEDVIKLSRCMLRDGLVPDNDASRTRSEFEDLFGSYLDHNVSTCLRHLRDLDLVHRWVEGAETLIIHDRRDEIVNGEDLERLVVEEIERVIVDLQANDPSDKSDDTAAVADGGRPGGTRVLRDTLAEALEVGHDDVEDELRSGDVLDRIGKLGTAVTAIKFDSAVEKGREYDDIRFIRNPYQYELSERAMNLINA
ncbi:Fe2+/Zn2+ uptake regulation protein, fur/PerR (plasmid) [Halanaeroarchaeum sp. HSR-CO]|uniref:hypothetical protein n=1 Tax=Halanaeroarchaeum sp. HSR-CO TaxID=2866382 RepID=UPI00217CE522|nr:hypothetical protein [Halanaeroarchaeum sp. HSR-CO]UWG49153.1 Fe2+/Zn2+ uptake regulation protein, fur/PerR [Halanaeroarchaeum sp. HSR-CO]